MNDRPTSLAAWWQLTGGALAAPLEALWHDLPNVVIFLKDRVGRYGWVNRTLAERCGRRDPAALIGLRPQDLFPAALARRYEQQDEAVCTSGRPVRGQLELHLYPNRQRGWCLTHKHPLRAARGGEILGLIGLSRDVETQPGSESSRGYPELAEALHHLRTHLAEPLEVRALAARAKLSPAQFSARVQRLFSLSPRQLLLKLRIDEALDRLAHTEASLGEIALDTGFCDQSALTRHFRRWVGLPPGAFRARHRP
jgi:AraC-like DNA-binding protein